MPTALFIAFTAAAAFGADGPSEPRPLNMQEVIRAGDYPLASVGRDQEGTVVVRLRIDQGGLVEQCKVTRSSGHPQLDQQTCALLTARAEFEPARDRRGRSVAGSYDQRITWKLRGEKAQPSPRQPWTLRSTVGFSADGAVVDCNIEAAGISTRPGDCEAAIADFNALRGQTDSSDAKGPIALFNITETYFYPVPAAEAVTPPNLTDGSLLARQISEIIIEEDGRISGCVGKTYAGLAGPEMDACDFIRMQMFDAAPQGAPPMVGTVVMSVYSRRNDIT